MDMNSATDGVVSASKLRLLALMAKSSRLVEYAGEDECEGMFRLLANFCSSALSRRSQALSSSLYSQLELKDLVESRPPSKRACHTGIGKELEDEGTVRKRTVCQCEPFAGECGQDSLCNSCWTGLCSCCEGPSDTPGLAGGSLCNTGTDVSPMRADAYCADCLCMLSLTQLKKASEFSMMVGWFGVNADRWNWIPTSVTTYGVFESASKWLDHFQMEPKTGRELMLETVEQILLLPNGKGLSASERDMWESLRSGAATVQSVLLGNSSFGKVLWPSLLHVLPEFVRQVEIYQLSNSSPDADLILVERHTIESVEPPASAATGDRFCLLLWNRLVSPHYDLLIPLTSSS